MFLILKGKDNFAAKRL